MAELVVSRTEGDLLVGLGLGSCIGLVLAEPGLRVAALAHIVLPASSEGSSAATPAKFADSAVPAMLAELERLGARRPRLFATMVGGAQMFSMGASLDIGARNDSAVRAALAAARIPLRAAVTGGSTGRTIRAFVGSGSVTCKEAGGPEIELLDGAPALRVAA